MTDETEPPTAAEMELNHRHGPDRTRTILDEMRSPRTLFGRHITTVARTPGRDPPEVVTPDTRGRDMRPALFSTNAITNPTVSPTDEPETTVSFTNVDTDAADGAYDGNLLNDAWLDTPDHLIARRERGDRNDEPAPLVDSVTMANRYGELSDDGEDAYDLPGDNPDGGATDTLDTPARDTNRRNPQAPTPVPTQELTTVGRVIGLRSTEWVEFCTRTDCHTIQHLVRLVRDAGDLAAACDAAAVDGHPLPKSDRDILDELHEWVHANSGGDLSTTHLLRVLTVSAWQQWLRRERETNNTGHITAAPSGNYAPAVSPPTPTVGPNHRFFAAAQALRSANRDRSRERLPWSAARVMRGDGRGYGRDRGRHHGRGRGRGEPSTPPPHRGSPHNRVPAIPPTRLRGALPFDEYHGDDNGDGDLANQHAATPVSWSSPPTGQQQSEWNDNGEVGHDHQSNEQSAYRQPYTPQTDGMHTNSDMGYQQYRSRGYPIQENGRFPPPTVDYQGNPMMTDRGKLIQRKLESNSIMKFDGRDEKFEDFKNYFHLQLGSRDIGYLLNPAFIHAWTTNTNKYDPSIAAVLDQRLRYVDQIKADNVHLFNLLGLAINGSPVGYFATSVLASRQPPDGIKLWQKLLIQFWNEDESIIKKHDLLQVLGTPMEKTEAMDKFLHRMEKAYGQLVQISQIRPEAIKHLDEEFKYWILAQIRDTTFRETKERLRDSAKDMTKAEIMQRLRATARTRRVDAVRQARRQARVAIPYPAHDQDHSVGAHIVRRIAPATSKGLDENIKKVISGLRQENAIVNKQNTLLTAELNNNKIKLPDEVVRLQARVDILNQRESSTPTTVPPLPPSMDPPKQYSNQAHMVATAGGGGVL